MAIRVRVYERDTDQRVDFQSLRVLFNNPTRCMERCRGGRLTTPRRRGPVDPAVAAPRLANTIRDGIFPKHLFTARCSREHHRRFPPYPRILR